MAPSRTIVALGGGGFSMGPDNGLLDELIIDLARAGAAAYRVKAIDGAAHETRLPVRQLRG